jgi:hypothetical protein
MRRVALNTAGNATGYQKSPPGPIRPYGQSFTRRRRRALVMTETLLKVIATT